MWPIVFYCINSSFIRLIRIKVCMETKNLNSFESKWSKHWWDRTKERKVNRNRTCIGRKDARISLFLFFFCSMSREEPKLNLTYVSVSSSKYATCCLYQCACKQRISFAIWSLQFKHQNNKTKKKTKSNPKKESVLSHI